MEKMDWEKGRWGGEMDEVPLYNRRRQKTKGMAGRVGKEGRDDVKASRTQ